MSLDSRGFYGSFEKYPRCFILARMPLFCNFSRGVRRLLRASHVNMPGERGDTAPRSLPPLLPSQQRWPRGPRNNLHEVVDLGLAERTLSYIFAFGSIDMNEGSPNDFILLPLAVAGGYTRIVRILLDT